MHAQLKNVLHFYHNAVLRFCIKLICHVMAECVVLVKV